MREFTPQYIPISEVPENKRNKWKKILDEIPEGQALVLNAKEHKLQTIQAVLRYHQGWKVRKRGDQLFIVSKSSVVPIEKKSEGKPE